MRSIQIPIETGSAGPAGFNYYEVRSSEADKAYTAIKQLYETPALHRIFFVFFEAVNTNSKVTEEENKEAYDALQLRGLINSAGTIFPKYQKIAKYIIRKDGDMYTITDPHVLARQMMQASVQSMTKLQESKEDVNTSEDRSVKIEIKTNEQKQSLKSTPMPYSQKGLVNLAVLSQISKEDEPSDDWALPEPTDDETDTPTQPEDPTATKMHGAPSPATSEQEHTSMHPQTALQKISSKDKSDLKTPDMLTSGNTSTPKPNSGNNPPKPKKKSGCCLTQ